MYMIWLHTQIGTPKENRSRWCYIVPIDIKSGYRYGVSPQTMGSCHVQCAQSRVRLPTENNTKRGLVAQH